MKNYNRSGARATRHSLGWEWSVMAGQRPTPPKRVDPRSRTIVRYNKIVVPCLQIAVLFLETMLRLFLTMLPVNNWRDYALMWSDYVFYFLGALNPNGVPHCRELLPIFLYTSKLYWFAGNCRTISDKNVYHFHKITSSKSEMKQLKHLLLCNYPVNLWKKIV